MCHISLLRDEEVMVATKSLLLFSINLAFEVTSLKLHHCPAGFYCAKSMRRSFADDIDYEMPLPCPRGTWSGAGAVECIECQKGYFTWDEASTFCEACDIGYMCPAPDVDPEPYPMGTYSSRLGQVCCKPCKLGSYTLRKASSGCKLCRPGTFCPKNEIKLACIKDTGISYLSIPYTTVTHSFHRLSVSQISSTGILFTLLSQVIASFIRPSYL